MVDMSRRELHILGIDPSLPSSTSIPESFQEKVVQYNWKVITTTIVRITFPGQNLEIPMH